MWLASLALLKNYPSNRVVSRDTLFQQIGWDDLIKNPGYGNTCAIRVSLALIRSGITIPSGRLPIKTIEPGQASNHPLANDTEARDYLSSPYRQAFRKNRSVCVLMDQFDHIFAAPGNMCAAASSSRAGLCTVDARRVEDEAGAGLRCWPVWLAKCVGCW